MTLSLPRRALHAFTFFMLLHFPLQLLPILLCFQPIQIKSGAFEFFPLDEVVELRLDRLLLSS